MIALNVYKNLCRVRARSFAGSLTHLSNIVFNDSSSVYVECTDSRISENPVFRQCRFYSGDSQMKPSVRLPPLSDFPVVLLPAFFKSIRNFFYINMVVRPHFDNEFDINEFVTASKQALYVVSNALAREDYDQIEGLVSNDVIHNLKQKISTLSDQQKELIAVNPDDICLAFTYEVGIMYEGEKDRERRFVEIMVVSHIFRGLKRMFDVGESPPPNVGIPPDYQERMFVCNYRFLREYTKGVNSPWIVNMVNHFMPIAL